METSEQPDGPLVILNPAANRGNMSLYRTLIRNRLAQEKAEYIETGSSKEAQERAQYAAKDGRAVIIVGGDGSMNAVVNGILAAGRRVPLGIVGAGSGNDFAWHTLKLPREPAAAVECAFDGRAIAVDAGIVGGKYFANSLSIGLDGDIAVAASRLKKIPFMSGTRLYYSSALRCLLFGYQRCPWLKIFIDESTSESVSEKRYVLVAITNGPTYGAGFRINPKAEHSDGLFDVCSIDYTPLLRALKLLPVVKKGEHSSLPEVTFHRARSIRIESRQAVNIQMDGETDSVTCIDARILPGALWVRI